MANADLGNAVKQALAGKNYRVEAERMDLHFTTLYDLAKGLSKSPETMIKFAQGLDEPPARWLALAGHDHYVIEGERSGSDVLLSGIAALQAEMGKPLRISFHGQIRAGLSVEEAEQTLEVIRQQAREGLFD